MKFKFLKSLFVALSFIVVPVSNASLITYTDRATFESALSSFSIDDYTDITAGYLTWLDRGDYSITSGGMYGCVNNPGTCGPQPPAGDGIGLFHYSGNDTFTFDTAINGFGFDYGQTHSSFSTRPIIDGMIASDLQGFFGVIFDVAKTTVVLNQNAQYLITDNLTFGVTAVPEPSTFAIFALGLMGLASRRFKKQS
jgi:hypothetical protein